MSFDILWFILTIGVLIAAFLFGVLYLLGSLVGGIVGSTRRLLGLDRHRGGTSIRLSGGKPRHVCGNALCRKPETRQARYCSQCGGALGKAHVDRHGRTAGARS
ncbi:MAG: hypothetical protein ACPGXK_03340 [Phycisphaerae bacterium]